MNWFLFGLIIAAIVYIAIVRAILYLDSVLDADTR